MRRLVCRALVSALALALSTPVFAQAPAPPADFPIPKADASPGQVTFSHRAHLAAGNRCSTCHMRDLKMKRGTSGITLEGKQQGKFCGACHDGKTTTARGRTVFPIDECDRCHKD